MSWTSKIKAVAALAGAKAKEFDDKHRLSEKVDQVGRKVSAKAKEIDDKHNITEQVSQGFAKVSEKAEQTWSHVNETHKVSEKVRAFDEKHGLSEKTAETVDALRRHVKNIDNRVGITDDGYATKIQRAKGVTAGASPHAYDANGKCEILLYMSFKDFDLHKIHIIPEQPLQVRQNNLFKCTCACCTPYQPLLNCTPTNIHLRTHTRSRCGP
jgi:hypothetical protein